MSLDHNAVSIHDRVSAELTAARKVKGCDQLVALLEARLALIVGWLGQYELAAPILAEAEREFNTATLAATTATERMNRGTLDPEEAIEIRDAADVARMARTVRYRELEVAKNAAESPLGKCSKYSTDRHRDHARSLVEGIVYRHRQDYPPPNSQNNVENEARLWLPYWMAVIPKDYDGRAPELLARGLREYMNANAPMQVQP